MISKFTKVLLIILVAITTIYNIFVDCSEYSYEVFLAQKKLKILGYQIDKIDGKLGPNTMTALRQFQNDNNINLTGLLDNNTKRALKQRFPKKNMQ